MNKICIYRCCDRRAAPLHAPGGPQPSICHLERHNALTARQERELLMKEESKRA